MTEYIGPGSPSHRLSCLLRELSIRFPGVHNLTMSDPPEPKYIAVIDSIRADLAAANAELTRYRAMEEWLRSHPNDCFFDVMNGGKFQFTSDYEQHNYDQDDTLLGAFDQMMIRRASGEGRQK